MGAIEKVTAVPIAASPRSFRGRLEGTVELCIIVPEGCSSCKSVDAATALGGISVVLSDAVVVGAAVEVCL
jgi:hypothetical protein